MSQEAVDALIRLLDLEAVEVAIRPTHAQGGEPAGPIVQGGLVRPRR